MRELSASSRCPPQPTWDLVGCAYGLCAEAWLRRTAPPAERKRSHRRLANALVPAQASEPGARRRGRTDRAAATRRRTERRLPRDGAGAGPHLRPATRSGGQRARSARGVTVQSTTPPLAQQIQCTVNTPHCEHPKPCRTTACTGATGGRHSSSKLRLPRTWTAGAAAGGERLTADGRPAPGPCSTAPVAQQSAAGTPNNTRRRQVSPRDQRAGSGAATEGAAGAACEPARGSQPARKSPAVPAAAASHGAAAEAAA